LVIVRNFCVCLSNAILVCFFFAAATSAATATSATATPATAIAAIYMRSSNCKALGNGQQQKQQQVERTAATSLGGGI